MNNINMEAAGKFVEEVKKDPTAAHKQKRVEGHWTFNDNTGPQYKATMDFPKGSQDLATDFPPPMGGFGTAPDPIQFCLFGMSACYGSTFVSICTEQGIKLESLKVIAENDVDLSKALGLSENPIVKEVTLTIEVKGDATDEKFKEIEALSVERCPGVYCLTQPIPLKTTTNGK